MATLLASSQNRGILPYLAGVLSGENERLELDVFDSRGEPHMSGYNPAHILESDECEIFLEFHS